MTSGMRKMPEFLSWNSELDERSQFSVVLNALSEVRDYRLPSCFEGSTRDYLLFLNRAYLQQISPCVCIDVRIGIYTQ